MEVLVLHNDNLPAFWREKENAPLPQDIHYTVRPLKLPPTNVPDYDTFVDKELAFLAAETYDLVVLPLNLTEYHIEYTGLRVAAHLRLTPEWNCLRTPILFLGPDSRDDVTRLSDLGDVLHSFNVYLSDKTSAEDLERMFRWIGEHALLPAATPQEVADSPAYRDFLKRTDKLPRPANYATHHSVANEWAVRRWAEMFGWQAGELGLPDSELAHMLYFKKLLVQAGARQGFSRKKTIPAQIPGIAGKRILYVDDEADKGWGALLGRMFRESGAELVSCHVPRGEQSGGKEKLLAVIEDCIRKDYKTSGGADCYLVDLRLHDDDFAEKCKPEDLSGHRVARCIKGLNPGNQVVFFTASNKYQNLREALRSSEAGGYVVKESPEQNYTREESKKAYNELGRAVQQACRMDYLRKVYAELTERWKAAGAAAPVKWGYAMEAIDLLAMDNGRGQKPFLKSAALALCVFVESYLKERFSLTEAELLNKPGTFKGGVPFTKQWAGLFSFKTEEKDGRDIVTDFRRKRKDESHAGGWGDPIAKNKKGETIDLSLIVISLSLYYGLPDAAINRFIKLKNERNTAIAHGGGKLDIDLPLLRAMFTEVVLPMLQKDYP